MPITASGLGSGLDVNSIVTQLVSAERSPADTRLQQTESKAKVQLSALGSFRSTLSSLQSALAQLKSTGSISSQTAQSSDSTLFTATASGASAGSFSVEVRALARANKLNSDAYASSSAIVGNGTVTLTVDGVSFTVTLADGANTLADLRDAINGATDNSGVSAAVLNETGGARLVLNARETGVQNAVTVTSAAAPLLPLLPPGPPFINWTEYQTAQDAEVGIEGFTYTSASNSISGALDGVTLNLLKAQPGTLATLTIGANSGAMRESVQNFVKTYNSYVQSHIALTKYDATTKTAAALTGDAALRSISQRLRGMAGGAGAASGAFQYLSQLGITSAVDGTLTIDSAKLDSAIAQDSTAVKNLFSGASGYATQMHAAITSYLGSGGQYENATSTLQARLKNVDKQKTALDTRMESVELRYRQQFSRLDSLISQLRGTSDFLSQQLSNLSSSR